LTSIDHGFAPECLTFKESTASVVCAIIVLTALSTKLKQDIDVKINKPPRIAKPSVTDDRHADTVSRRSFVAATGLLATGLSTSPAFSAVVAPAAIAAAEERRPQLMGLMRRLVEIQSLSGESADDAQDVVREFLSELPYRIEASEDRPGRYVDHPEYMPPNPPGDGPFTNVLGWPTTARRGQAAMFAHIDTHSIDPGWTTPPLSLVSGAGGDPGRIAGLGTSDDKGGVAAMLVAAAALADLGEDLPVVMSLHGKGGGSHGSLPIFDRLSRENHGINAVLYVHPAETGRGLDDIKNAVQGVVDLRLTVRGWRSPPMEIGSLDSADWDTSGNAIDMCWRALSHLRDDAYGDVLVNVGEIDGGDRPGSAAVDATANMRLKFSGDNSWRALLQDGRAALEDFQNGLSDNGRRYSLALELSGYRTNPGESDWNSEPSKVLRESIEEVTGRAPDAYPNHYAGDIRYPIRLLDVPAYGIGSIGGNFYGPNEWVDEDDLVRLVAVLIQTMSGWNEL